MGTSQPSYIWWDKWISQILPSCYYKIQLSVLHRRIWIHNHFILSLVSFVLGGVWNPYLWGDPIFESVAPTSETQISLQASTLGQISHLLELGPPLNWSIKKIISWHSFFILIPCITCEHYDGGATSLSEICPSSCTPERRWSERLGLQRWADDGFILLSSKYSLNPGFHCPN